MKYFNAPSALPIGADDDFPTKKNIKTLHEYSGGKWFYQLIECQQMDVKALIEYLPLAITLETQYGDIGIVHAEVPEDYCSWDEMITDLGDIKVIRDILWGRNQIQGCYDYKSNHPMHQENQLERYVCDVFATVHGHISTKQVVVCGNQVWIDTLLKTGKLTLMSISELAQIINSKTIL